MILLDETGHTSITPIFGYLFLLSETYLLDMFSLSRNLRNQSWPAVFWVEDLGREKKMRSQGNETKFNGLHSTFRVTSISLHLNSVLAS